MSSETPRSSMFKSRFSILSLLPSRHPPLHVSHPMPERHQVSSRHATVVSSSSVSPVHSEYPDPSTPLPPLKLKCTKNSPKRPPPLDLQKTKLMYPPGHSDVIIDPGTSKTDQRPDSSIYQNQQAPPLPKKEEVKSDKPRLKPAKKVFEEDDDRFDVAEVEIGHRYPSWKGGKVDLKPGQVLPREMIPSLVSSSNSPKRKTRTEELLPTPDQYESVLHNVLLTPTYLGNGGSITPSSLGESSKVGYSKYAKRRTLLDKASETITEVARNARNSKWLPGKSILKPTYALEADRSLRAMRDKEEQEMERFRKNVKPVRLNVPDYEDDDHTRQQLEKKYGKLSEAQGASTWSISSSSSPIRESSNTHRRSPGWIGAREYAVGTGGYEGQRAKMAHNGGGGWRSTKAEEDRLKRKQMIRKISIVLAILILAALIIGLCTTLLRKDSKSDSSDSSSNSSDRSDPSTIANTTGSNASGISSESVTSCLDQFRVLPEPSNYPCSDCVPILSSIENDFSKPMINGNATGVGSALQFCALRDIYSKTNVKDGLNGWLKDSSPCGGWNGISCDSRGRITGLLLQYPNVPNELPDSLSNIWALEAIHIMGNGSVPTGKFPSSLLSKPNLKTIDIEYTALSGPIDQSPFSSTKSLNTLVLINNSNLGNSLPDLSNNQELLTLSVTGQGLLDGKFDKLPKSITYLDLSYNSLNGQIPSFTQLNSLNTLYLQNNKFQQSPSSLPESITTLSLTSNSDLSGSLPSIICNSKILENCDLRLTKLSGTISTSSQNQVVSSAIIESSSSSSSSATSSGSSSISSSSSSSTLAQPLTSIAQSATLASVVGNPLATSAAVATSLNSMVSIVGREPAGCGICKFS
ncbi:uncharacterized protein L201_006858 [Kwoniella dendrophila CBS 6074]|uniref:Leucine-rich repeat-containing N-terminal plant-type domain-containing protein n=1 Tax=Kwoniella dendrophila CBS 6074 TaxID=1295534 RepID=A0AAX4K488_9TREE